MAEVPMTVGQAARSTGVSAKAIRLWEAKGLLTTASRTANGYRLFTADDLAALRFIRQAKTLGLRLDDIGEILDLRRAGHAPCGRVVELLDRRITEIDQAIDQLHQLRTELSQTRHRGSAAPPPAAGVCPIIEHTPADGAVAR